jgi:site-specific DNA recombinase
MKSETKAGPVRCAIYTRKSTEEGLDQAFNSLDAQREACAAYAASQVHDGWEVLEAHYDDGGFSGGNLTRPALQRLMTDIKAGRVDLVVVYKIDRLTRSLMDFFKLVEVFDQHETSFVSVTQHFNTTSSMGRLTLNVLLSFAQFEREVTGERIRDKIAASKRKGMWMGGSAPLGYAMADKALVVDEAEAALVRHMFERYLVLGCVSALKHELDAAGMHGRCRLQRDGETRAMSFSRGCLYSILKRRLYRGEVHHRGEWFAGLHAAIVPVELWQAVQAKLERKRYERRLGTNRANPGLLAGMITNGAGQPLMATHTSKGGKRYRYYLIREGEKTETSDGTKRLCLPAHDVDRIATEQWLQLLTAEDLDVQLGVEDVSESAFLRENAGHLANRWAAMATPKQREVLLGVGFQAIANDRRVEVSAQPERLAALLLHAGQAAACANAKTRRVTRTIEASLMKSAGETRILEDEVKVVASKLIPGHQALLTSIAQGRAWARALIAGSTSAAGIKEVAGMSDAHLARALKSLMIPPDLVVRLVQGKGPSALTSAAVRGVSSAGWDPALKLWRNTKS